MGYHESIPKPFTVPNLAQRWGCSEGLIRKMIDRGELRSFRLGILIRVPAEEVERVECQTESHTPSSGSSTDSPWCGGNTESADASASTRRIVRAPRQKRALSGPRGATSHGQSAG